MVSLTFLSFKFCFLMFRSYQVVPFIDGLLSYSHFIIYEKNFLVVSSHILSCQMVSYIFFIIVSRAFQVQSGDRNHKVI